MAFAERFYAHYPVVAFGHWPPLFYVIQALWGLLAGSLSRASGLILIAALTSIISTVLYHTIGARFGQLYGLVFGALFATTPIVQVFTSSIMAEMPLTLFTFAATLAFARLLPAPTVSRALWFGVCLFSAISVKGDGWAVLALPLVVPLLVRSPSSLLRKHIWVPTVCGFLFSTLMTLVTLNMTKDGFNASSSGFARLRSALPSLLGHQFTIIGIPLAICACLGILITVVWPLLKGGPVNALAACNFTLLGSVILLHAVVPVNPEPRYLCMSIPSFLMFAAAGLNLVAGWLSPTAAVLRFSCPLVVGTLITLSEIAHPHYAQHVNMGPFAQQVLNRAALSRSALFAEVASLEGGSFQHAVIRAGKLIADSSWLGSHYRLLCSDPVQALVAVEAIPISAIVLYTGRGTATGHCQVLHRMVDANGTKWSRVRAEEVYRGRIEFFVATPLPTRGVRLPKINLHRSLGRDVSAEF
jgi:4-amino-4-deoxy-L-arabinose transferase-like glycosyltransferase